MDRGSGGGGALRRCGTTREQGLQAPAVRLGRCGEMRCKSGRAVRTPHKRAVLLVTALRRMSGQGGVDWTERIGGGGELRACSATRGHEQAPAVGLGQGGQVK